MRGLLRARRRDLHPDGCSLLLFSGQGFTPELKLIAEQDPGVRLISLDDLYR